MKGAAAKNKCYNRENNRFCEPNTEDSDGNFTVSSTLHNLLERRVEMDRTAITYLESMVNILVQNHLS
jgi:hypothetical protein